MSIGAKIYLRKNGSFGASCDGCADTGYFIAEDSGRFTVYPDGGAEPIIRDATREQAELAIAADWRQA